MSDVKRFFFTFIIFFLTQLPLALAMESKETKKLPGLIHAKGEEALAAYERRVAAHDKHEQILQEQESGTKEMGVKQMEPKSVQEKSNVIQHHSTAWKEDLGSLSRYFIILKNPKNWRDDISVLKGSETADEIEISVPTDRWMKGAVLSAKTLINKGTLTSNQVLKYLDDALSYYYAEKNNQRYSGKQRLSVSSPKRYIDTVEFVKNKFFELLEGPQQLLEQDVEIQRAQAFKKMEERERKRKEREHLSEEQQLERALKANQKQLDRIDQIKRQFVTFDQLEQLLQSDELGKGWLRHPSQRLKDKIVQAAFELLQEVKNTYGTMSETIMNFVFDTIGQAIENYANTKTYFPDWFTINQDIEDIINKTRELINYNQSLPSIEPTFVNKLLLPKTTAEQQRYKKAIAQEKQHILQLRQKAFREKQSHQKFELLLREVSKGWQKAPTETWQNNIVTEAIELLQSGSADMMDIVHRINDAIDNYSKRLWFPDKKAITAAKTDIFERIDAGQLKAQIQQNISTDFSHDRD